jgi:glycosyltransferase involved in cell wall biosynthesis
MNNSILKLSVALTTYNHQEFISIALDSIISQSVDFNYEIVIGEDMSGDNTLDIIKKYRLKYPNIIRILDRKENLGYTKNFDDTLKQCKGEYVAIFDGDDIMLAGKLQKQVDFLDCNQNCVMVGHKVEAFDSNSKKILRSIYPSTKKEFYCIEDLIYQGSFFANSSKMFRRSAYPKNGIDFRIKFIADWAVTMDIVEEGKIGFLWENLSLYRVHNSSIMNCLKGIDDFNDKVIIINHINDKYNGKYEKLFYRQWAYAYLINGIYEINNMNIKLARRHFIKSLKFDFKYSLVSYFYFFLTFLPKVLISRLSKK